MRNTEHLTTDGGSQSHFISKNAQKKEARYAKTLERHRENRKEERLRRKARKRMEEVEESGRVARVALRICVDMSLVALMSTKEKSRLVAQLGRIRGIQNASTKRGGPVDVCLLGLDPTDPFLAECKRRLSGFQSFDWEVSSVSPTERFRSDSLTYLCPDAENPMDGDVDLSRVYVLGGLVDETPVKAATSSIAIKHGTISTRRLPIKEFMRITPEKRRGSGKLELPLNIVVQILVSVANGVSWTEALSFNVPKRTGYVSGADVNSSNRSIFPFFGQFWALLSFGYTVVRQHIIDIFARISALKRR